MVVVTDVSTASAAVILRVKFAYIDIGELDAVYDSLRLKTE